MVRAITSMTSPGQFRLRLGICPGGEKCLEAHSSTGLLTLMTTSCRFVSNHVIVEQNVESELASSPGLFFRLRNGRTETEARKKGLVSIARVTFDHSPESGESVHTRIFVCDISPYNHVKMALQEAYCLRCNL